MWYDPSYWIEGAEPRFDRHRQLVKSFRNLGVYFDLVFAREGALLVGFVALCWLGARGEPGRIFREWPVWIPALAALGMYVVVLVQERYVAAFLIVLWVMLFSTVRLPREGGSPPVAIGVTLALALALGTALVIWQAFRKVRTTTGAAKALLGIA